MSDVGCWMFDVGGAMLDFNCGLTKILSTFEKNFWMPNLYIIAGCNGAGKTTASYTVLPEMLNCREFVNADEIAKGISPFQPENAAIDAGKIMLSRINELIKLQVDFSFETTLAPKYFVNLIDEAQQKGYFVTLVFFWLNTVDLAIERVKMRVSEGGHNIPEDTIRRRYKSGISNLVKKYIPVSNYWIIINNSKSPFTVIAEGLMNNEIEIKDNAIWNRINTQANE
jgi:predicted ABC-type ATPase